MQAFQFNATASVRVDYGGSARFAEHLEGMTNAQPSGKIMLVTDAGLTKLKLTEKALTSLEEGGFSPVIFDAVEADPTVETILSAVRVAKSNNVSRVIGFGGGSPMDIAKLVSLLAISDQPLEDIYGVNLAKGTRLPLILVPTTAGTGSEATPISIVTTGESEKKGVVSPVLIPDIALLDAELTLDLPPSITAATGVDAMVHAIEAYTSTNQNNNPISKLLATKALELLGSNIEATVGDGRRDPAVREAMILGSMLAGQAFANSPVGAVHALAYPIGSLFHVPHGLSNALVLSEVMKFNARKCHFEYAQLAPLVFEDIDTSQSSQTISARFIERLGELYRKIGLAEGLRAVGITDNDIDTLADHAMNQTRLLVNNPVEMTRDDAAGIYRRSL